MRIVGLRLRDYRSYRAAEVRLGPGVTVVHGRNGAGKTNLLEAVYVACTGASWRSGSERELIRFGADVARVELDVDADDGRHALTVGLERGRRRLQADGASVERMDDVPTRPLAAVFLPDRLELVKAGPSLRRAHIDQVVAALWPARRATRRAYGRTLAQRNALLARGGSAATSSLDAWDAELARLGTDLMTDRSRAVEELGPRFRTLAAELGLSATAELAYRPRSTATHAAGLAAELRERRSRDLERRFTAHGPHRDDLGLTHEGRELRTYGSQGQQRLAVLALLLAEREAIGAVRGTPPVMLLDDAMSELDAGRRELLVARLRGGEGGAAGQSVITTTDLAHVPGAERADTTRLAVAEGVVLADAEAHAA